MKPDIRTMLEEIMQYESVEEWYMRVSKWRRGWYNVLTFFVGCEQHGKFKISKGLRWSGYHKGRKKVRTIEQVRASR